MTKARISELLFSMETPSELQTVARLLHHKVRFLNQHYAWQIFKF